MAIDLTEANRALENGEFVPYFQPQVQLRSGRLTGFEVLARWNHVTKGLILPDDFIPHAERDGWIHELTSQILEKAFRSALSLAGALQLSVNISPIQLRDRSLAKQFDEVARQTGFSLERVIPERLDLSSVQRVGVVQGSKALVVVDGYGDLLLEGRIDGRRFDRLTPEHVFILFRKSRRSDHGSHLGRLSQI